MADARYVPEAVLEVAGDVLEMAHTACTGGLATLRLLAPVVRADLGGGVAARRAGWVLVDRFVSFVDATQCVVQSGLKRVPLRPGGRTQVIGMPGRRESGMKGKKV